MTKKQIERQIGATMIFGLILDGPGPARRGWGSLHPGKTRWEGRSLREIATRLKRDLADRRAAVSDLPYEERDALDGAR